MLVRALVVLLLLLLAGCGGDPNAPAPAADGRAVRVELDAGEADPSGPPDAGVATGHGADLVLRADGAVATITGTVDPPDGVVRLTGPDGPATARVAADGSFAARVTGLRPGSTRVRVTAERPGRARWSRDVQIVRR